MRRILIALAAASALALSIPAHSQSSSQQSATAMMQIDGPTFVKMAMSGGMFEVQSGQMALAKSQNQNVKQFAQQMIDDHAKVGEQLKAAAQTDNLQVGADMQMDAKHQQMLQQLQSADTQQFDQLYMQQQAMAHDEAIMLFDAFAKSGDTPELKGFAQQTLPALQQHKQMLMQMAAAK
jgi:putative membrane protein